MLDPSFKIPESGTDSNSYQLLFVGSLIREKGVKYLIESLSHLSSDISLRVVGTGDQRQPLESLANRLEVNSRIDFTGQIPYEQLCQYYTDADLFVHPGVWPEPFGRTLLEAMQAGLPVVATNLGGPAEIVQQDELLCPPRNAKKLAETISLARDRSGDGVQNQAYVYKRYSPETVIDEICDVYQLAMDGW
ncbi:group 1 glycosyl transferase [Haloferax sulfurifontis ATCC BAA-897]|uniref:Group 1 glycosyl transferase n=2 Tax=Haloferax sulfurifontis TaxID=255616 RepID=M0IQI0_9EURY|nr:group 1 glycosyl transferase [Haloferax sulfurifontis ATCC BAA-897]